MKTTETTTLPTSIQRVVHDGYVTLNREIKVPYNNQQYTSNTIGITVSRPTLEEAIAELEVAEAELSKKLDIKDPAELTARIEKQNAFLASMKTHPVIGPIFMKELQSFNSK
jgi:hypothetical protein